MPIKTDAQLTAEWTGYGKKRLLGRKIVDVRYMSAKEADTVGFEKRPIVIVLDNGTLIYPSADDEGNDGGALFGQGQKDPEMVFPTL